MFNRISDREPNELKKRRSERVNVSIPAVLHLEGEAEIRVLIHNVSNLGFMAETAHLLPIGCRVALLVPNKEPVAAVVSWELNGWFGCKFDEEDGFEKLASLLTAVPK